MNSYKLRDLIKIHNGTTYKHLEAGDIPLYGSGGIMSYVNDYLYDGEAILLPRKGTLTNIMYTNGKIWTVDTMYYATVKYDINPYYLYSYLSILDLKHLDSGSALPSMTKSAYEDLEIKLPSFSIQNKIASILSSLDKKIELNNKINQKLEVMAKTLYDYWFVQFDFPDAEGKPYKSSGGKMVYSEELKREIPEGWEVKELSDIANITMGQSPSGDSYNENEDGTIFFQGSTDFGWRFPTVRQYTTKPSRMAKVGDVLLSVRAPVGTLNIAGTDCCIGRGLAALHSKDGHDAYLYYVMTYFKKIFDLRNASGTTFGSITKDDLFSLQLVHPSQESLDKYEAMVSTYNKQIFINHKQNKKLTKLRDWLLPMLMNGQINIVNFIEEVV